jgi:PAS domain-containing protein
MGVVLTCRNGVVPGEDAAFLICTHELRVSAISEAAERIFGKQDEVLGADLLELVSCPLGEVQLGRHAALAALRPGEPVVLPLRLLSDEHRRIGTLAARIATCGPPRAALVTVEPTGFGRH